MRSCGPQLLYQEKSNGFSDAEPFLQLHGGEGRSADTDKREKMARRRSACFKISPACVSQNDAWTAANYAFTYDSISLAQPIRLCEDGERPPRDFDRKRANWRGVIYHLNDGDSAAKRARRSLSASALSALWISLCVLSHNLVLVPVHSQSTVHDGHPPSSRTAPQACHEKCVCIFGESKDKIMKYLLKEEQQLDTWGRLENDPQVNPLTTVLCSKAMFKSVPAGLATGVEVLFLDNNVITGLTSSDLMPVQNDTSLGSSLLVLSLSKNRISNISPDAFQHSGSLKILILRNNSITSVRWTKDAAPYLVELVELDLSMNQIDTINVKGIGAFGKLERLDLSKNHLRSVDPGVFLALPKLTHLDLSSNRLGLQSFGSGNSFIPTLLSFSLAGNPVGDFKSLSLHVLSRFSSLESLDLSRVHVPSRRIESETFEGMMSLKFLNLSSCGIATLEQGWLNGGPHEAISELDLSKNQLSVISAYELSAVFSIGTRFETVAYDFSRVPDEKVERKWLQPLPILETLHLGDNRALTTIEDDTFDYLPRLRNLFLQNCAIRRLNIASARYRYGSEAVARTLPRLTNVWFYGNPLECDCYVRVVKEWSLVNGSGRYIDAPAYLNNNSSQAVGAGVSVCVSPAAFAGRAVMSVPQGDMTCQVEPYSIIVAMLIGPLTFAASILLTIICGSFHVCIVKMKKGAVESYHAREGAMRKNRNQSRRTGHPDPIISSFSWSRPSPAEDRRGTPGSVRHTNIVLGQLGTRREERHRPHHGSNFLSVPGMSHAPSLSSLDGNGDFPLSTRHSVGYCSGTECPKHDESVTPLLVVSAAGNSSCNLVKTRNNSDGDSVIGHESLRSRSPSNDIPFMDERGKSSQESNERSLLGMQRMGGGVEHATSLSTLSVASTTPSGHRRTRSGESDILYSGCNPSNGRTLPVQGKGNSEEETSV